MKDLIRIANEYDNWIMSEYQNINKFYSIVKSEIETEEYIKELMRMTSSLRLINSGQCSYVYHKPGDEYVLKIHYPFNEHVDLNSNPTLEIYDKIKKNPDVSDEEVLWYNKDAVPHFLFYDYVSKNGLAAIQKKVDCSYAAQRLAETEFNKINPKLTTWNHRKNYGMDGEKPVYVDWN